jgi:hypothetical protein
MEELLQKLQSIHGLSTEQSKGILNTITGYIKEKFPMVSGAIDNLFQSGATPAASGNTATEGQEGGSILDKISDFIPGGAGQKIEDFAKNELGSLLGGKKTS